MKMPVQLKDSGARNGKVTQSPPGTKDGKTGKEKKKKSSTEPLSYNKHGENVGSAKKNCWAKKKESHPSGGGQVVM